MYRRRVDLRELYRHFDSSEVFQPQKKGMEPREVRLKLQETMWENVGILRDEAHLKKAAQTVRDLYDQICLLYTSQDEVLDKLYGGS